ncbi:MAG: hypothetical protein LC776_08265 [Acidobacteria bacterium]|nr:hypothetical protein [Acidobacteriota bacterium]
MVKPESTRTPRSHHRTQANAIKAAIRFCEKRKSRACDSSRRWHHSGQGKVTLEDKYSVVPKDSV